MPNHIDDSPDETLARSLRDHFVTFKELNFESGKQRDSIVAWLVGMSTGAIALIISQSSKLSPALYPAFKWGIGFLAGTIIFGLLFRGLHLFVQKRDILNFTLRVGWLTDYVRRSMESTSLERTNAELVEDMLVQFDTYTANLEGLSLEEFHERGEIKPSEGIRKRRLKTLCNIFYTSMFFSYGVSIAIISWSFINTDLKADNSSVSTNQQVISPSKHVQPTQVNKSD